jgi:hypothetical protein
MARFSAKWVQYRLSAKWVLLVLFLVVEFGLVRAFHHATKDNRETIAFGATVVGAAFALYTYMRGIDESRAQVSHHLIERWTSPDMVPMRAVLMDILEKRLDPSTLVRANKDLYDKRNSVVSILNFLEEVSIAVHRKAASEGRLRDFYGAIVRNSHDQLMVWIDTERDLDGNDKYYIEFEKLAIRWKLANRPKT